MTPSLKFQPGTVVATIGARMLATDPEIIALVRRHLSGDWGDVDKEDAAANERAVKLGERVFSSYRLPSGEKLWVITESSRESTTVLTPGEY